MKYHFETLRENLIHVTQESQVKLGYARESLRLYYPLAALNRALGSDLDADAMSGVLEEFRDYAGQTLGEITVTRDRERFCFLLSPEAVEYVHENAGSTEFLAEFIECLSHCDITIEEILDVFRKYSEHVVCEKMDSDEFDYLIYFADGVPDDLRYCIHFEGDDAIYHRFTPRDYEAFGF